MCTVGDQIKESKLALPFPCRVSGGSHLRALALPPRKVSATVKVAPSDGQRFGSAIWLHKARELPQVEFKHEVEKHLTGKDTEPYELVTFKLYRSQLPVVEQALETARLMLGSDNSRGFCLEMICADFLAGAQVENGSPSSLLASVIRLFRLLPSQQKQ